MDLAVRNTNSIGMSLLGSKQTMHNIIGESCLYNKPNLCFLFQCEKAQQERHENAILKAENEKLRAENTRYREAFAHSTCPNCGSSATALGEMSFDDQHLRIENSRLRDEVRVVRVYVSPNTFMF